MSGAGTPRPRSPGKPGWGATGQVVSAHMISSEGVLDGLRGFYSSFNTHDADAFAAVIAAGEAVSVIGSAPGEGHGDRES